VSLSCHINNRPTDPKEIGLYIEFNNYFTSLLLHGVELMTNIDIYDAYLHFSQIKINEVVKEIFIWA